MNGSNEANTHDMTSCAWSVYGYLASNAGHLLSNAVQSFVFGGTQAATSAGPKVGVPIQGSSADKDLYMATCKQCRQ